MLVETRAKTHRADIAAIRLLTAPGGTRASAEEIAAAGRVRTAAALRAAVPV